MTVLGFDFSRNMYVATSDVSVPSAQHVDFSNASRSAELVVISEYYSNRAELVVDFAEINKLPACYISNR